MHVLLEEFNISLKSSLCTQSGCHTVSPRVGVQVFSAKVEESGAKNILTLVSET